MSFRRCIDAGISSGRMDEARAREARDLFDELEAELRGRVGPSEARRQAAAETLAVLKRDKLEKKRRDLLQVAAWQRVANDVQSYRNLNGENDIAAAVQALLDRDELATFSNVEARRKALRGRFHSRMTDILERFRRDVTGRVRHKAELENLVREAFGEDTGDLSAKEFARAWHDAAEFARLKFNAAGGRIASRADWGMPQIHETLKVRQSTFEEWRDFVLPKLDINGMIDEATGRAFAPERLETALRDVFETIRTDGFAKIKPSAATRGRSIANRRTDHRFLKFKNADAWLAYQAKFGADNAFDVMIGHLDGMARDVALMEVLGPNPRATLAYLSEVAEKQAAEKDAAAGVTKHMDRTRSKLKSASEMFNHLSGGANTPIHGGAARTFAGLRSFLQSAQLGAAALSAVTDVNFQRIAAKMAGLPQAKEMTRFVKLLNPASIEDQKTAVRLGLIAENWSTQALAQARFTGEVTGPEFMRRLADGVMRASYLSHWTQSGRWAFGMEFMGHLADQTGKTFDQLDPKLKATFARYGIGADRWDIMRSTDLYEEEGATFLRPDDIAAREGLAPGLADDVATRLLEMVQSETEFAVPSSSLRGRTMMVSDVPPGTIAGELMRSVAMYKNFAVTLMFTHVRRAMTQPGLKAKGAYATDLVISTTVMGALALQLKEISKGRDPRPADDPAFWSAALLQGGGLGIFGDFLFSDLNRFDRGLAETVAGPVVAFANDVRRLTLGNLVQLPGEDPTNFGREFTNFARRYTPGGSLWYLRLAYERMLLDRLQQMTDPRAAQSMRARERRIQREFGQGYWWKPGEGTPSRSPDLANIWEKRK